MSPQHRQKNLPLAIKRVADWLAAALLLAVLSPALIAIALLVLVTTGWPVLFCQARTGKRGKAISLYKFRSMTDARDAHGHLLPDAQRLTRLGQTLRLFSLDELPQLWNVLRGDVSLVGPRPLLPQYLPLYSPEQARRHEVLPGITGWAQVNGRNALSWEQKFALDVWYVDHWSLWLDCKILCLTISRVVQRDGVRHGSHSTMPKFTGSEPNAGHSTSGVANAAGNWPSSVRLTECSTVRVKHS